MAKINTEIDLTPSQIDLCRRCANRELNRRTWFYPKWVAAGKKTAQEAEFELEGMRLIKKHFDYLQIHTIPEQQKLF